MERISVENDDFCQVVVNSDEQRAADSIIARNGLGMIQFPINLQGIEVEPLQAAQTSVCDEALKNLLLKKVGTVEIDDVVLVDFKLIDFLEALIIDLLDCKVRNIGFKPAFVHTKAHDVW